MILLPLRQHSSVLFPPLISLAGQCYLKTHISTKLNVILTEKKPHILHFLLINC